VLYCLAVLQIRMYLGLPDPDPLVRGMDPAPDPSCQAKIVRKTLIPTGTCFMGLLYELMSTINEDLNINKQKT
jgi:hypothetical protein